MPGQRAPHDQPAATQKTPSSEQPTAVPADRLCVIGSCWMCEVVLVCPEVGPGRGWPGGPRCLQMRAPTQSIQRTRKLAFWSRQALVVLACACHTQKPPVQPLPGPTPYGRACWEWLEEI
jgi:hypothetical protein